MTRAVRDGLPMIRQLRESGITWAAIAAAMSAQGLNPGVQETPDASRLTAIVGQVEAQLRRQAKQAAVRRVHVPISPTRKPPLAATPMPRRRSLRSRPRRHPSPTAPHTPAKRRSGVRASTTCTSS